MLEKGTDASRFEGSRRLQVFELEEDATVAGFVSEVFEIEVDQPTSLQLWRVQMTR